MTNTVNMDINSVRALQEGDVQVFNDVFEMYWEKVYIYLAKKTGNNDAAKDLTQLVFIKLWKYKHQLTDQISLNEQIFRKSKQIFIDWLRQELRTRARLVLPETLPELAHFDTSLENSEIRRDIYNALQSLPPRRKEIFELKHIHGYSYKEIASLLGISTKTIDNQLHKANLQLRKILHAAIYMAVLSETNYFS